MLSEYSASAVATEIIAHLERRRPEIVDDEERVKEEVRLALVPMRRAYQEYELPMEYMDALEVEILGTLPARWRAVAQPFTALEKKSYGLWRGGDVVARVTYVFLGLVVGGLCVEAPFIPIWEKWFPFLLAIAAWWLPDAQKRFQKRAYSKSLGQVVNALAGAQPQLDRHVTIADLLPAAGESSASSEDEKK